MDPDARVETALEAAIARATSSGAPPLLSSALRHAVFPGGARIRPRLCLAVADAYGEADPEIAEAAAVAVELMHCASLVHDDLPCFDDADTRRGKPSVHKAFGEPIAVLAGDALIVLSFEEMIRVTHRAPSKVAPMMAAIARGVGSPRGIVAGQALECEPPLDLETYHIAKTGALFIAAATAGALAAGADPSDWVRLGAKLGEAYQVADDIRDATQTAVGKPGGQDAALGRPNAARKLGVGGAVQKLRQLIGEGLASIPDCSGADAVKVIIMQEAKRFLPKDARQYAAA